MAEEQFVVQKPQTLGFRSTAIIIEVKKKETTLTIRFKSRIEKTYSMYLSWGFFLIKKVFKHTLVNRQQ